MKSRQKSNQGRKHKGECWDTECKVEESQREKEEDNRCLVPRIPLCHQSKRGHMIYSNVLMGNLTVSPNNIFLFRISFWLFNVVVVLHWKRTGFGKLPFAICEFV